MKDTSRENNNFSFRIVDPNIPVEDNNKFIQVIRPLLIELVCRKYFEPRKKTEPLQIFFSFYDDHW